MALHDFKCPVCEAIKRDVPVPVSLGASRAKVLCHACADQQYFWMNPIPAIGRMSVFSDAEGGSGRHSFEKFTLPVEDRSSPIGWRQETIGSLADIRRVERESEQRARNGEGQPLVWRDYSQDASNRDRHTLGEPPSYIPAKHYLNGTPVTIRRGDPVIADHGTVEEAEA